MPQRPNSRPIRALLNHSSGLLVAIRVGVPSEALRDAGTKAGIDAGPVGDDPELDFVAHVVAGMPDNVSHQVVTVGVVHDLAYQSPGLGEIVVLCVLGRGVAPELGRSHAP